MAPMRPPLGRHLGTKGPWPGPPYRPSAAAFPANLRRASGGARNAVFRALRPMNGRSRPKARGGCTRPWDELSARGARGMQWPHGAPGARNLPHGVPGAHNLPHGMHSVPAWGARLPHGAHSVPARGARGMQFAARCALGARTGRTKWPNGAPAVGTHQNFAILSFLMSWKKFCDPQLFSIQCYH